MRKLNDNLELFIIGVVLERPLLYLCEFSQIIHEVCGIAVSPPTICRLLKSFQAKKLSRLLFKDL